MRRRYAQACAAGAAILAGALVIAPMVAARTDSHSSAPHGAGTSAAKVAHQRSITIDGARPGRAYQGTGAISGGGGNSRLLVDYPPTQRQQILDYLFKPGYGAALQMMKIEIGGDAYATDGAEPSMEHAKGQINCNAGYEFWLAEQATKLNPNLQLYALQWNAPHWIGGASGQNWSMADIDYIMDWMNCAKKNGLQIKYLGGWNEKQPHGITPQIVNWFVKLRARLDADGYNSTQLVAMDSFAHLRSSDVSTFLAGHPDFRKAVSVLGYHNLCKYPATGKICLVPKAAIRSGKPIWESEIGALRQGTGVGAMARSLTNAFIQVDATGFFEWPLVSSEPAYLPEEDRGLMFAPAAYNGTYKVTLMTWVLAQTTQFTEPGWRHVNGANGVLGGNWGSYNAYESPDRSKWSLVVQTTQAAGPQRITVHLKNLPKTAVHVFATNLRSGKSSDWFIKHRDVSVAGGKFSYVLRSGFIYSFSNASGHGKGKALGPKAKPMPLTYTATPDAVRMPKQMAPIDGSFEYPAGDDTTFEQTTVNRPTFWQNPVASRFPYAVVGGLNWRNYTVSSNIIFTDANQSAGLITRFTHPKANGVAQQFGGYQFTISTKKKRWYLLRDNLRNPPSPLLSGPLKQIPALNTPVKVSLTANGHKLTGSINGVKVFTKSDKTYNVGDAGVFTGGWYQVKFSNYMVRPVAK
jgi:hypothetical protein